MTRERGIPNRQSQQQSSRLQGKGRQRESDLRAAPVDPTARPVRRPVKPAKVAVGRSHPARDRPTAPPAQRPWIYRVTHRSIRFVTHWKVLLILAFVGCGGSAALALAYIFQLPGLPNCPAVFWPLASASMRFECARIAASKENAKDLLEAIALVDGLPADHPMRAEANRLVELWSQEVLKIAEESFNQGKLDDAIAAARQIPANVTAHKLVDDRIKRWNTVWNTAETLYHKAEDATRKRDWKTAFQFAVKLLDIENKYWRTTKYDELTARINTARDDGNKLYKAERLAEDGGIDNLLQAIKLAEEIRPESYIYQLAQSAIPKFGRKMIALAQTALDRHSLKESLDIISKIPKSANLEAEIQDFTILANAQSQVWQNTVAGLEAAISQAQRLRPDRPSYKKAQQWIVRWQYEIEGLAQLERARTLAVGGAPSDLLAAIAAATQISQSNPRWPEAHSQIQEWQAQIQTAEDRPYLDQADQFASQGSIEALQAAIAQASQIGAGRSLHSEAQSKIRQWRQQVQGIQDQPYLDQARTYAQSGNLSAAISSAAQIQPGRALYSEAQTAIAAWRSQIQAQIDQVQAAQAQAQAEQTLQTARQLANTGTPTALVNAIQTASAASATGTVQADITAAINEWSWQLLQIAKDQAGLNPAAAIAIAQKIPQRAAAYSETQTQIAAWKQYIKP